MTKHYIFGAMAALVMLLSACSQEQGPLPAAPLGENAVLEKLATAYTTVSDQRLTISPMSLSGKDRRDFLVRVFNEAGYDYSASLKLLALELDKANKLHRDLADLVLMPHHNQKIAMQPAEIYLPDELMDVATVERKLKQ